MKIVFTILCVLSSAFLLAQQSACDTSACTKKKAGNYQVEVIKKCGYRLNICVNDSRDKPLHDTIIGYVEYFFRDNTYVVEDFYQYPNTNYLEAEIPCTGFYDFKITLIIKGKTVEARFENECTLKTIVDSPGYKGP